MDLLRKLEIFKSRFQGRPDMYGRARKVPDKKTGGERTVYSPVCGNFYADVCHIKRGTDVHCIDCEHQAWEPVSDKSISQHISGHHMHNLFPVLEDGTVRFGVVDFDMKPGKEDKGYDFFEVKKFCTILKAQNIGYGTARSTTAGYHVCVFFKDPFPAAKVRAVMQKLFEACGFDKYVKERTKTSYPEIFPKQDFIQEGFFGSGVTPPMVEPLFLKERKCWVDDNDVMIGRELSEGRDDINATIDAQWEYLDALPWADPATFDAIIEHYALKVDDLVTLKKRAQYAKESGPSIGGGTSRPHGSMEKVMFGCEAFRELGAKLPNGHDPSHYEGMALWLMAINTVDGREWFRENVPTWGQDQGEIRQLEQAVKASYRPYSCESMKVNGICFKDGLCLDAAPRLKTKEGADQTDGALEDLNEIDQKRFNPYRYSYSQGADLFHKLLDEATKLLEIEDVPQREDALRSLAARVQVFEKRQQKAFKEHVDKIQKALQIPKNRVGPIFKAAEAAFYEQKKELLEEDPGKYEVGSNVYRKRYGGGKYGYFQIIKGKDDFTELLLCEIDILIHEERYYMEEGDVRRTVYRGKVVSPDSEKNFEIRTEDWASDVKFLEYFTQLMGTSFSPIRKQLENIKQAAIGWSEKRKLTHKVTSFLTQGFYHNQYLMPSVTVDAMGLRPTKAGAIDTSQKEVVKHLDWKILDDDTVAETLRHLKDDFLVAWPAEWTYIGLAHVFRSIVMPLMNWGNYPTLFFDGLTGLGKSEITKALQAFWGDFPKLVNLGSSQKYLEEMAYEFKDACLVLDDFKNLTPQQRSAVLQHIQYGYDGSATGKLNRDSTMRKARFNRSTTIMSGEGFIHNHSSVVARTILIEASRFDNEKTRPHYMNVMKMQPNYSGITPRFLHWLLGREKGPLHLEFNDTRIELQRYAKGRQNASRIAENLAGNRLVWTLFTRFMEDNSVILASEREEMDAKHMAILQNLFNRMVIRCEEEQEAANFKTILTSLIVTGRVVVTGLKGYPNPDPRATVVGFVPDPENQKVGYYFPDAVIQEVNEALRQQGVMLQKRTVSRQLADLKIIISASDDRNMKQIRRNNALIRVWVFDHTALELVVEEEGQDGETMKTAKVVPIRPESQAMRDTFGIF